MAGKPRPIESRIARQPSGCWLWTGARNNGYGRAYLRGRQVYAHRVVYETLVGPVPEGKQLDHLCRERLCVNPAHLEPVTARENVRRGIKGVLTTACPNGHRYTPANTRTRPNGHRVCRACHREREQSRRDSAHAH